MFKIKQNVSLAPFTTFRIGGNADYYAEAAGALELAEAFEYADAHHLPTFILGGGSNVLFADKGFHGLVIGMTDGGIHVFGETVMAGAGMPLFDAVWVAKDSNLAGIENLAGIPGTIGGAVRGNAGAFGVEMADVVVAVKVFVKSTGMVKEFKNSDCGFAYRESIFKKNPDLIILSVELRLSQGEKATLERIIKETMVKREAKHAQDAKCAGSFFINPVVQDETLIAEFRKDSKSELHGGRLPAGWLIDHVGLRGKCVGGAMVSNQHPNYIVNDGTATAEDVVMLASLIKQRVRDDLGVQLKEEVQFVGF